MRKLLTNRTGQIGIPCVLMRGGTSKGPFFFADDLPSERAVLERVLLAAMGSPDTRQINGIGGADTLTSKIAIISKSKRPDAEIDYLFAQCSVDKAVVDFSPNCGNMLAAVGPYAIETGLVTAQSPTTRVRPAARWTHAAETVASRCSLRSTARRFPLACRPARPSRWKCSAGYAGRSLRRAHGDSCRLPSMSCSTGQPARRSTMNYRQPRAAASSDQRSPPLRAGVSVVHDGAGPRSV